MRARAVAMLASGILVFGAENGSGREPSGAFAALQNHGRCGSADRLVVSIIDHELYEGSRPESLPLSVGNSGHFVNCTISLACADRRAGQELFIKIDVGARTLYRVAGDSRYLKKFFPEFDFFSSNIIKNNFDPFYNDPLLRINSSNEASSVFLRRGPSCSLRADRAG